MPRVVVPPLPGVTRALGILHVDLRHDLLRSLLKQRTRLDRGARAPSSADLEPRPREVLEREQAGSDQHIELPARRPLLRPDAVHEPARSTSVPRGGAAIDASSPASATARARVRLRVRPRPRRGRARQRARAPHRRDRATPSCSRRSRPQGQPEPRADASPSTSRTQRLRRHRRSIDRNALGRGAPIARPGRHRAGRHHGLVPPGTKVEVDGYLNLLIDVRGK